MGRKRNGADEGAKIGHNSNLNDTEKGRLDGVIREVERLNDIIKNYGAQRSEVFKTAKEAGFDTKAIKHMIKMRAMDPGERDDFERALDAYTLAMGDFVTTPLGQAGMPQQPGA